ncbi:MAG: CPBP family intramembrane metalloprotease [Cyclobacteriaceae bacterium]|nr:CPBP family intramembrane metalloprotease [Cyclobacteriaceae bacterium]
MDLVFTKIGIELLVIAPIIYFGLYRIKVKWRLLLLFVIFFMLNQILLELPRQFSEFSFTGGSWNWSGKIYAIIGSIVFYFLFRKDFSANDFFTLKQKKGSLKTNTLITAVIGMVAIAISFFLFGKSEPKPETLFFQLTMPGFDEEIAFRGIMLGLLATLLKDRLKLGKISFGNPAVLITAILFGLVHSLHIDKNGSISQNWIYFAQTFLLGWIWGWMTIKSRSILMALVSHNLTNTLGTLTTWIK